VPHKVAHRLYIDAANFPRREEACAWDEAEVSTVLQKTAIILIVNPAHQTALNTRKTLINQRRYAADKELRFAELLLRGIKACAKESALWTHRRWCLHYIHGPISDHTDTAHTPSLAQSPLAPFLPPEAVPCEFATVKEAVTIYPRSYHAWAHWRYVFDLSCALIASTSAPIEERQAYSKVVVEEFRGLRKWIETHTTDTSAVHHLVTSLPSLWGLTSSNSVSSDARESMATESSPSKLAKEAWCLLSAFQPHRETNWIYLRSLLVFLPAEERRVYSERMSNLDVPWAKIGRTYDHIMPPLNN
jgi:protein prenyltransferase alpha subunit repeat containing protein 1